ncbi:MAG: transaldolase [Trueperaceae bacterium]|nr:MAG: transaldolase [Trueperaceae bacterium]
MNPLRQLATLGQSVYLDEISRTLLRSGELERLIADDGLHGVTSNPAIFEKAIAGSDAYDDAIRDLAVAGRSPERIFEALAIEDIQDAADLFADTYRRSDGQHGYVSLEVSPKLAFDSDGTVHEARRLWAALDRPNVLIKVPGTAPGLAAIRQLTAEGINLNVTLLFGLPRYQAVAEAYRAGLRDRLESGRPLHAIASVASFFLSRIDVAIDPLLDQVAAEGGERGERAAALRGTAAIASAKRAYVIYHDVFGGDDFAELVAHGARPQWLLWASTGVKDERYPPTMYVEPLIGASTITTLPRDTLDAYRTHGAPAPRLSDGLDDAARSLRALQDLGIDLDHVTHVLEGEGVEKFVKPYQALLGAVATAATEGQKSP